ncbi:MAG: hypothetical protein LBF41_04485 [Deltaproteobacteria bacterium]|jgi:hypothetical protein|nr:hypothetical protein [Deltaproteobacteria bacterium]
MSEQNADKPSIRCPGCGGLVFLPADACPVCLFNFREGKRPAGAATGSPAGSAGSASSPAFGESRGRNVRYAIGAAAAVLLTLVLILALSGSKDEPAVPEASSPGGSVVLQPAPKLSESPLMRPQRPIGAAKDAAGSLDERTETMEDIYNVKSSGESGG